MREDPEEKKIRGQITMAIKAGIIPPAKYCICKDCGVSREIDPKVIMNYHHDNYENPLDVIPLCRKCHTRRHVEKDFNTFSKPKSAETKRKMSEAGKGKVKSEEHKRKIGEGRKGKGMKPR